MKIQKQITHALCLGLVCLTSASAFAAGFVEGPHFYFPVVQDADGWDYKVPECAKLEDRIYKKIRRQCKSESDHSKRCAVEKTITLKNVAAPSSTTPVGSPGPKALEDAQKVDESTKTFRLDYIVFISEKQCKEDRELAAKSAVGKPKE